MEDSKAFRSIASNASNFPPRRPNTQQPRWVKTCTLCKAAGRKSAGTHWLRECSFLPDADRKALAHACFLQDIDFTDDDEYQYDDPINDGTPARDVADVMDPSVIHNPLIDKLTPTRRVSIIQSPFLRVHYGHHPVTLTLECGATTNMISATTASRLGLPIKPATQNAQQADGKTPLSVTGKTHIIVSRGKFDFALDALVVRELDVDILAGTPFMTQNDVAIRPAKKQIILKGLEVVTYGTSSDGDNLTRMRRSQAFLLRAPNQQSIILPGEYLELAMPHDSPADTEWALEPRYDTKLSGPSVPWPQAQEVLSVDHNLRLINNTSEPVVVPRHAHLCQIRQVSTIPSPGSIPSTTSTHIDTSQPKSDLSRHTLPSPFSDNISVNPDGLLSRECHQKFVDLNRSYDRVFNPQVPHYNGKSGNIQGVVNMGPVLPPQRKGRLPHYGPDRLIELQNKCDDLEAQGILAKPEQVGVNVEYLNLTFLVQKPNGGTRLVTDFGDVGRYSKPQPSLLSDTDTILRSIAEWKYLIKTDLTQSYQILLSHSSMKFCGIATPYKGIRLYTRCAMGMPGLETALEELMSRVLGEFIVKGFVAKIADDLYVGGDTEDELFSHWQQVLQALAKNNLGLSAHKTTIAPQTTIVLGWLWRQGTIQVSPHRITALAAVIPPKTVRALRSFIRSYKVLSRVLQNYSAKMQPLDQEVAGRQSNESVTWTDALLEAFHSAQSALKSCKVVTLPRPSDTLWIVTDGAVKEGGMGATLYILRHDQLLLAGFFSARLRKHQVTWLPCEVEALSIATAVNHFAPYIIQAAEHTHVLTDSRPCVLAYNKLCRGEFSNSARVTSFLSTASRYQVVVGHIAGSANLPSDYASRNPVACQDSNCQVCSFVSDLETSVVRTLSVTDVTDGAVSLGLTLNAIVPTYDVYMHT